jgi:hypothetical protein
LSFFEGCAEIAPVVLVQVHLVPIVALYKRIENRLVAVQVPPQPACLGGQGRDDLLDALVAEATGQGDGCLSKAPLLSLKK